MKKVLVFLTDGFADWEASYVTPELNKPDTGLQVKTVGIDRDPKVSMGGLTVLPDYRLQDVRDASDLAMLILPGGTGWREDKNQQAKELVATCFQKEIPVAAICDATTFLGMHGFLDHHAHTGNSLSYLKEGAPTYQGEGHYIEEQSVLDRNLITANGSAALEFSRDILKRLGVLKDEELEEWYSFFKKGFIKA
ncbi:MULTISPECIES: type 1 glutamine amidotransferase family protein [Pontibacillus]|uniref:Type 1 glutamine amidotransferase family protein n=1 Tax=Pontibacillus chungwhensis TaxID=265426 RepID=A0ABY8V6M1_9BACI|nr:MULTISPECIES: type 1 glutamine amidotransferase family protein [Pontibacillus]MCD5322213.1 glutamine amidotransferase [Pontibacillus sp. HN14]WIF99506.1 type 1 glutamine amidotransferase family protein [Pontibacillus chungwhensis]